jgi:hypothetical protein
MHKKLLSSFKSKNKITPIIIIILICGISDEIAFNKSIELYKFIELYFSSLCSIYFSVSRNLKETSLCTFKCTFNHLLICLLI